MISIEKLAIGPLLTNCFLVADKESKDCVVVDPSWDDPVIMERVDASLWNLKAIWLTHAHFDHIAGVAGIIRRYPKLPLALHRLELPLYRDRGGAQAWGIPIESGPEPTVWLDSIDYLDLGAHRFEVLFVPGHSPGHVAFYDRDSSIILGGDVLFQAGIGRTDLPGGDHSTLLSSIQDHFLTLPDDTKVYPGHGDDTTIGHERRMNPFL